MKAGCDKFPGLPMFVAPGVPLNPGAQKFQKYVDALTDVLAMVTLLPTQTVSVAVKPGVTMIWLHCWGVSTFTITVSETLQPTAFVAVTIYWVVTEGVAIGFRMLGFESPVAGAQLKV